jgi:FixJ family two-component response regulator
MPGMSGLDLVRVLRRDGSALPVVLMAAANDLRRVAPQIGTLDVRPLEKPFAPGALALVVRQGLSPAAR